MKVLPLTPEVPVKDINKSLDQNVIPDYYMNPNEKKKALSNFVPSAPAAVNEKELKEHETRGELLESYREQRDIIYTALGADQTDTGRLKYNNALTNLPMTKEEYKIKNQIWRKMNKEIYKYVQLDVDIIPPTENKSDLIEPNNESNDNSIWKSIADFKAWSSTFVPSWITDIPSALVDLIKKGESTVQPSYLNCFPDNDTGKFKKLIFNPNNNTVNYDNIEYGLSSSVSPAAQTAAAEVIADIKASPYSNLLTTFAQGVSVFLPNLTLSTLQTLCNTVDIHFFNARQIGHLMSFFWNNVATQYLLKYTTNEAGSVVKLQDFILEEMIYKSFIEEKQESFLFKLLSYSKDTLQSGSRMFCSKISTLYVSIELFKNIAMFGYMQQGKGDSLLDFFNYFTPDSSFCIVYSTTVATILLSNWTMPKNSALRHKIIKTISDLVIMLMTTYSLVTQPDSNLTYVKLIYTNLLFIIRRMVNKAFSKSKIDEKQFILDLKNRTMLSQFIINLFGDIDFNNIENMNIIQYQGYLTKLKNRVKTMLHDPSIDKEIDEMIDKNWKNVDYNYLGPNITWEQLDDVLEINSYLFMKSESLIVNVDLYETNDSPFNKMQFTISEGKSHDMLKKIMIKDIAFLSILSEQDDNDELMKFNRAKNYEQWNLMKDNTEKNLLSL